MWRLCGTLGLAWTLWEVRSPTVSWWGFRGDFWCPSPSEINQEQPVQTWSTGKHSKQSNHNCKDSYWTYKISQWFTYVCIYILRHKEKRFFGSTSANSMSWTSSTLFGWPRSLLISTFCCQHFPRCVSAQVFSHTVSAGKFFHLLKDFSSITNSRL